MTFTFTSKLGSMSFREKLRRLLLRGRHAQAEYLLCERESRCGRSLWNPGYGLIRRDTPTVDAYGHPYP